MFDTRSDSASETSRQRPEWARWHATTHGVELLEAEFVSHVYERHIHETYAVGVTLKGVQRFWCRGATRDSTAGNIIVINPGDVHDGESGNEAAYAYRMIYVPVALMRSFVEDATERAPTDMNVSTPLLRDALLADEVNAAWAAL